MSKKTFTKADVTDLVHYLGGTCHYSGKEKTMFIKSKKVECVVDKKTKKERWVLKPSFKRAQQIEAAVFETFLYTLKFRLVAQA